MILETISWSILSQTINIKKNIFFFLLFWWIFFYIIGYYRVHYDYENWHKISNYLSTNHTKVHNLDLAQVIDDAFYFLTVREVGLTMFWNLAYFLAQSTSYIAWHPMFKIFEYMACMYNFDGLVEIRVSNS